MSSSHPLRSKIQMAPYSRGTALGRGQRSKTGFTFRSQGPWSGLEGCALCPGPALGGGLTGGLWSFCPQHHPLALKDREGLTSQCWSLHTHWATQAGRAGPGRGAQSSGTACAPRLVAGPAPHTSGHQSPAHICWSKTLKIQAALTRTDETRIGEADTMVNSWRRK